ncbi:MAG: hypothetical protein AAF141_03215 [Pseudomonadota bacterium]
MTEVLQSAFWATAEHALNSVLFGFVPLLFISIFVGFVVAFLMRDRTLARFSLFFSVAGAAIGLMLGSSREPVVAAILPVLLATVAGYFTTIFPKQESYKLLIESGADEDQRKAFSRRFVATGIASLILATTMGSFWGASLRAAKTEQDRRYAEWLENYEEFQIPFNRKLAEKQAGLSSAD